MPHHKPKFNKSSLDSYHIIYHEHVWETDRKEMNPTISSRLEGPNPSLEQVAVENQINNTNKNAHGKHMTKKSLKIMLRETK